MLAPEYLEYQNLEKKSQYLFHNPENFMTEEMKEWLSRSSVAHIAPLWLPLPRDGRTYGGAEDVVINNISRLDSFGVKKQYIFGNPNNKSLENTFRSANVKIPDGIDPSLDLLHVLRTDRESAERLERSYVL